jgi:hypothetical protein
MPHTDHNCDEGWICEEHPTLPWPHDDCAGPGMPCSNLARLLKESEGKGISLTDLLSLHREGV